MKPSSARGFAYLTTIILLGLVVVVGVIAYQQGKKTGENTSNTVAQNNNSAKQALGEQENQKQKEAVEEPQFQTYFSQDTGLTFKYPDNFELSTNPVTASINDHEVILIAKNNPDNLELTIDVDPDGYGPFFPNKTYWLEERGGALEIERLETENSEYVSLNDTFYLSNVFMASNGHGYWWFFTYDGPENEEYDKIFKDIIESAELF